MEGLRLIPSALTIPKVVARDTSLTIHTVPSTDGEESVPVPVFLKAGTHVRPDVVAMSYDRELCARS